MRSDLSRGLQAAQSVHAAFLFAHAHPDVLHDWLHGSSTLVVLSVENEAKLLWWHQLTNDYLRVLVREPDLDDQATALAVAPTRNGSSIFRGLPLAGTELVMAD